MRRASVVRCGTGASPQTDTLPPLGMSTPVIIFSVVDLPAPFGPM